MISDEYPVLLVYLRDERAELGRDQLPVCRDLPARIPFAPMHVVDVPLAERVRPGESSGAALSQAFPAPYRD